MPHVRGEDLDDRVRVTGDGGRGRDLGVALEAALDGPGEVLRRQYISMNPSVSQPSAAGSTLTVKPVMAPVARSRSTRRLTAGADRPTIWPMSA